MTISVTIEAGSVLDLQMELQHLLEGSIRIDPKPQPKLPLKEPTAPEATTAEPAAGVEPGTKPVAATAPAAVLNDPIADTAQGWPKGRGRPRKESAATPPAADTTAPAITSPVDPAPSSPLTADEFKKELRALAVSKGEPSMKVCTDAYINRGYASVKEIKPEDYAAILADAREAVAAVADDGSGEKLRQELAARGKA